MPLREKMRKIFETVNHCGICKTMHQHPPGRPTNAVAVLERSNLAAAWVKHGDRCQIMGISHGQIYLTNKLTKPTTI